MRVTRTEKIDLRLTAQAKRALQSAAEASHKTLSDFVLESALARADSVLAERFGQSWFMPRMRPRGASTSISILIRRPSSRCTCSRWSRTSRAS
jgi:Protein of unknown function (DUF1778)